MLCQWEDLWWKVRDGTSYNDTSTNNILFPRDGHGDGADVLALRMLNAA